MNTEEILTLATQVVSAWDWVTEVSQPRPNMLDVKIIKNNIKNIKYAFNFFIAPIISIYIGKYKKILEFCVMSLL